MTVSPFITNYPAIQLDGGQVVNPAATQIADGYGASISTGRNGDLLVGAVHGKFYAGGQRGNVFCAQANASSGRTILAAGGTTSGFMFYNPAGSTVRMEIIEILVSPITATNLVGGIGLEYGAPPSTVANAATPRCLRIGGSPAGPVCLASYGSTIVAMTFLQWLPVMQMTTSTLVAGGSQFLYRPDGMLVIEAGGAINICGNASQSANLWMQHVIWAEWPV
jgi:hypothetical protein